MSQFLRHQYHSDLHLHAHGEIVPGAVIVLFFHGGGFVAGDPLQFEPQCAFLAEHGITGISVEYRLRSRHKTSVYESIEDAVLATRHVIEEFQPSRLYVCGASSGGLLAYHAAHSHRENVTGMILFNPVVNLGPAGFRGIAVPPEGDVSISPLHMKTGGMPKTLVMQGNLDKITPPREADKFIARLRWGKVNARIKKYFGSHGFFNKPHWVAKANQEILAFIEEDSMELPTFAENIRLVVWDLDETFWTGTLEEGEVSVPPGRAEILETLARRGIISSICSKNTFEPTQARLEQDDLWKWFVFPAIDYDFKSNMISNMIEQMGLRAETILFIDDNHFNRGEVTERVPGANVVSEEFIRHLLTHPQLQGKPDPQFARLERYRVLEMKQREIKKAEQPRDFLRECEIKVSFHFDTLNEFPRIHDLVNRTNQLNFTKVRWKEDLTAAHRDYELAARRQFNVHSGYVKVRDKFGYYGIVGFFEVFARPPRAVHFLFSCRVLNMGVEQFVYQTLNYPQLSVQGKVAATLEKKPLVDWITVVPDAETEAEATPGAEAVSIAIRGPCELVQCAHYLRPYFNITEEFQTAWSGWVIQRPLLRYIALGEELIERGITDCSGLGLPKNFGALDFPALRSAGLEAGVDVGLYSFSLETNNPLYRHKETGLLVPFMVGKMETADVASMPIEAIMEVNQNVERHALELFQQHFAFHSRYNKEQLEADVQVFARKLREAGRPFIIVEAFDDIERINREIYRERAEVNQIVRKHLKDLPGAHFVSYNEFVKDMFEEVQENHFTREVYARLAAHLKQLVGEIAATTPRVAVPAAAVAPAVAAAVVPLKPAAAPAPAAKPVADMDAKAIMFLHIPKTAGQSVHHFLTHFVGKDEVCPARVNEQLVRLSVADLNRYRLFSGHLDWAMLDCVKRDTFTFTVLREPVARIVSFYLYLLREAKQLTAEQLGLPHNSGKKAILEMSVDEYFTSGNPAMRGFLDNHYDNFYTYYFAGRRYDGRQRMLGQTHGDPSFTRQTIYDIAVENLKRLDGIYSVEALGDLERDIRALTGKATGGPSLTKLRVNTGDSSSTEERMEQLEALGATKKTFHRIEKMVELDKDLWERFKDVSGASLLNVS
jgi:FkbH-like protein